MPDLPPYLARGERARLFPVLADTSKEGRSTSILLSCLSHVREFGQSMPGSVGQRVGTRARIDAYTEIAFASEREKRNHRPDGLLVLGVGNREWRAFVEAKVGNNELNAEQIIAYLELAKAQGVDAVITVSNQFTAAPDLCCGDGCFTAPLACIVEGQVDAVDIDPAMIEQTRTALADAGTTVLSLLCADARDLPHLLPGKVDCVLIANTFHGVPDKTAMARAAASVLNPGGCLIIVNWHPLPREETVVLGKSRGPRSEMRMSVEDVRAAVEPAGLTLDGVIELPPFHCGAIFRITEANGDER